MRQGLLIILIVSFSISPCFADAQPKKGVKKGNILYNKGEFEKALRQYEEALIDSPDSDIVNYNLGTALYKTEDYEAALEHFEKSLVTDNQSLEQKASYNLGNAAYKYGITQKESDLQRAVSLLKKSLHHYEHALELDPEDDDAKYNYELVKKELERLEEKLKQQKQQTVMSQEKEDTRKEEKPQKQEAKEKQQKREQVVEEAEKSESEQKSDEQLQIEQPSEKESEEEKQARQSESAEEMSEKEAKMLLDSYRQEEEPRVLFREKAPLRGLPEVLKDW
jgi:Ca-activated chloride channel family protein